jgi:hypothetical protein
MKRTRHSPAQIVAKLRDADGMLAPGRSVRYARTMRSGYSVTRLVALRVSMAGALRSTIHAQL